MLADDAAGRDLLVSAQTGSGKTVAFGLAIATNLLGDAERFERAAAPLALIVAPTRELALQVQRELAWLYQYADARVVSCVGGMDPRARAARAGRGRPHRRRHARPPVRSSRRGRLDVSELKAVVLDEADEMLDLGFREDLEFILEDHAGRPPHAAVLGDAAARHRRAGEDAISSRRCASRSRATKAATPTSNTAPSGSPPAEVEHAVVNAAALLRVARRAGVLHHARMRCGICRRRCSERGFSVVALSGELTQNERNQALQALRDGRARVCVATDVAARGIDLPNLDLVIHADLPNERGSPAASLRPHRPRRPQGRQRPAGAAGAQAPRGIAAESGRHRRRLGHGAARRKKSASSIRSAC